MKRFFFFTAGWVSLTFGIIGIVVPVWPTTVFVLLAAYFFARGSERAHTWLITHRFFGPMISRYHAVGVSPRVKAMIIAIITLSIGATGYFFVEPTFRFALIVVWAISTLAIFKLPYHGETKLSHVLD